MIKEQKEYSLLNHNTFGIDVKCSLFVEYESDEDLYQYICHHKLQGSQYLHIGQGSNLLFQDNYAGVVFHSRIKGIKIIKEDQNEVLVSVGAGEIWDEWVSYCVAHHWYGIENLSLIPGEVGAAAVQNIGAYGVEAKDTIDSVRTINIRSEKKIFSNKECNYSYRDSIFKLHQMKDTFITEVVFRLSKRESYHINYGSISTELSKYPIINLENVRQTIIDIRNSKLPDPKITGNAGSFFMNPIISKEQFDVLKMTFPAIPFYVIDETMIKIPAGWLIEQCGWKGKTMGTVGVHDKQSLVLINKGGAKGKDVIKLCNAIRKSVAEKFNINIYPEVNII